MSPWGLIFCLGVFLFFEKAEGAIGAAEGKSLKITVEGKDRREAMRVAVASVAAVDLFDELFQMQLQPLLHLRGKLVEGGVGVRRVEGEGGREWLEGDPASEDFAGAWVAEVIMARIRAAAGRKEGSGSVRWVAEGCVGRASGEDEGMRGRVAARVSALEEVGLERIQSWSETGQLAGDRLTRDLRRLLASRLLSRAASATQRLRFREWVVAGCPGKFWSDSREEDGAWRRSLTEPDVRSGAVLQSPEETQKRLRELAQEVAKTVVQGAAPSDSLKAELIMLEAKADPFLRPAIFRYRQTVEAGSGENEKERREMQEKAWQEADASVARWREMRRRADQLLDWYELNVPDACWGPILRDREERMKSRD